jgi:hypothetical protein
MPIPPTPPMPAKPPEVPNGMHQAKATAITIFITFSLLFLRYWTFENTGDWNPPSITIETLFIISLGFQVYALVRGLRIEDNDVATYQRTIRIFKIGVYVLLLSVPIALIGFLSRSPYFSFSVSLFNVFHGNARFEEPNPAKLGNLLADGYEIKLLRDVSEPDGATGLFLLLQKGTSLYSCEVRNPSEANSPCKRF